jgi:hypothetical protein
MADSMERHIGPPAGQFLRQVFSLHDPAEVRGLLEDALRAARRGSRTGCHRR